MDSDILTQLKAACWEGNVESVNELLDKGGDRVRYFLSSELLFTGIESKNETIVKLLLGRGSKVNIAHNRGYPSPLHIAAKICDVKICECLIESGAKINYKYSDGQTPFFYAVEHNNEPVVEMFIKKGINVNHQDTQGRIPLHIAAQKGSIKLIRTLLDAGSDVYKKDASYGETPFFYAVENNNIPVVEMLIDKGIDVNQQDFNGDIPLHSAAKNGFIELVRTLLDAGSDIFKEDDNCETPFFNAVRNNNISVAEMLIEKGIDVNHKNFYGRVPLHSAANYGYLELVRILLDAGSEIDAEDINGQTPLFMTASIDPPFTNSADNEAVLKLLLDRGAKINKKDKYGYSPILRAIQTASFQTVQLLLNAGAVIDLTTIHISFQYDEEVLEFKFDNDLIRTKTILMKNLNKIIPADGSFDDSEKQRMFELDAAECKRFEDSCVLEVQMMKIKKFGSISLWDVLIKTDDPTFADNIKLQQFINSCNVDREFPNHAVLLKSKFEDAKKRNNLLKFTNLNMKINVQETVVYLPNEIQRQILSYLSNDELEIVKIAFQNDS